MVNQSYEQSGRTASSGIDAQFEKLLKLSGDSKVSIRTIEKHSTFFPASLMTWDECGNLDID